jgi:hypothetical protein
MLMVDCVFAGCGLTVARKSRHSERVCGLRAPAMTVLAECRSYDEFVTALRSRMNSLAGVCEEVDAVAGLPNGYTTKLLAPIPIRHFGRVSLGLILTVLGLKLVVVTDGEGLLRRRNARHTMPAEGKRRKRLPSTVWTSEGARRARARQVLLMSPAARRRSAQLAAVARWRNGARNGGEVAPVR